MAILEKIRNKAALLSVVVGIALFSFIIGDFLRSSSAFFNKKKENILIVNGKSVNYQDYLLEVNNRINTIRKNSNYSLTDNNQYQIKQRVLNEMIDDILFDNEVKKIGLVVSKEELKSLIVGKHISSILKNTSYFQNPQTKRFDKTILLQFLQIIENDDYSMYSEEQITQLMYMKKIWLDIVKKIIKTQLEKKLNTLFSYAILINSLEAKAFYEDWKINVDFDYVTQPYDSIPNREIYVSNTEIQNLYNKQGGKYKREEITLIDYIILNITPSIGDYEIIKNKLKDLRKQLKFFKKTDIVNNIQNNHDITYTDAYISYKNLSKNQKHFVNKNSIGAVSQPILTNKTFDLYKFEEIKIAPDSIKLDVLIIPSIENRDKFTHLCDSLVHVIKKGSSFEKIKSSIQGIEIINKLVWMTESKLISKINTEFKDKVFKAKINEPTIIKSGTNTFLIQVAEKTKPIKKYKIVHIRMNVTPSQITKSHLYNKLNQIISSNSSLEDLKCKKKYANFDIQTNVKILKNQLDINGIQNTRQIIQWAFNNKKNTISDIFECQNGRCFMVAIVKKHLKEICYSKHVLDILKKNLINNKKAKKLIDKLRKNKISTLEQYAKLMNTKLKSVHSINFLTSQIPNIGEEPVLSTKILKAPINQILGPYAGEQGIYVFYVTKKNYKKDNYDAKFFQTKAQKQNIYRIHKIIQFHKFLRENAKINNYYNNFF
ncbi:MAG: SurA N-terminal domain-containing protein [Bacteroidales bacterium OttesenSCG-928-I14]|jgi:peptidyl-prolyl cis-trans isomerase D|nr:SurA N-terminal domain-containing protein [Bacteroidales bacterium OttesenSCG-928-I14]